jgi:hypothetical protein
MLKKMTFELLVMQKLSQTHLRIHKCTNEKPIKLSTFHSIKTIHARKTICHLKKMDTLFLNK